MNNSNILTLLANNWTTSVGNSIEYEYYNGVSEQNPSGNKNIKFIHYKKNDVKVFTMQLFWDIDDDIVEIKNIGNFQN